MSCPEKQQSSTTIDNPTAESLKSDTSFVLMETNIKLGTKVAKESSGKDLVILLGGSGAGKSVLFNYLMNIPMQEYAPTEKGIQFSLLDYVIDIVDSNSNAATVGHTDEAMTLIPQINTLLSDLLCCDSPGFMDNRGVEISVANAVNIRNILYSARGVKIILLLEFTSLTTGRQNLVETVGKIARNLFGSEEGLIQHADSILLGITKIPRDAKKVSLNVLKEIIRNSVGVVIRCLADNLFIFDPLDKDDLKYEPVSSRNQLIEKLVSLPSIANPREVFRTSLSSEDFLAVQEVCEVLDAKIQKCLSTEDLIAASRYFQKLKSLKVLEHPVVERAMQTTRKSIKNFQCKISSEIELNIERGDLDQSADLLLDLGKLVDTFEDKESDEELSKLEVKYKDKKWWRVVKTSAVVAGVATACIIGGAAAIVMAPAIPIGILGGVVIGGLASSAELGIVAGVTKKFTDDVENFSAKATTASNKEGNEENSSESNN